MIKYLLLSILLPMFACVALAQDPYVTIWDATSASKQITIPATGTNFSISWEKVDDPTVNGTAIGNGTTTITFPLASNYKVSITPGTGSFSAIQFKGLGDRTKLLSIEQWGDITWSTFNQAYFGCIYMDLNALDTPNLSNVTDMNSSFATSGISTNAAMSGWDVSNVTDMRYMFYNSSSFNQDISKWDVSKVTSMVYMFYNASQFNQPLGNWDVSKVTDMYSMFYGAVSFNQPIGDWDVSKVTGMSFMFFQAKSFNKPIGNWDVSSVIYTFNTFAYADAFNQPIGDWNVSNVIDMGYMFLSARAFSQPIGNWNVSKVASMTYMFAYAQSFNQPIGNWDVANVTDMSFMFYSAWGFNQDINNWDVGNVQNMKAMFDVAKTFNGAIGNWNVKNVTNMTRMFQSTTHFNQDIGNWDVSKLLNMSAMFRDALAFNKDINNWNVSNVFTMFGMFDGAVTFNQPVGNWNVSSVGDMRNMFNGASAFNQDISNWDVSGVTNMSGMFTNAIAFNQNIGSWDLHTGLDIGNAFTGSGIDCSNYSKTLKGWADNPATPNGLTMVPTGLSYDSAYATAARNTLTVTKSWTITGDIKGNCAVVPLRLISFDVYKQDNQNARLAWQTANESGTSHFIIERSANDAGHFAPVGEVVAIGNSAAIHDYRYTDSHPVLGTTNYYQLKMVDIDGAYQYSKIRRVDFPATPGFIKVYPNPAREHIIIQLSRPGTLRMYNSFGARVMIIELNAGDNKIGIHSLSAGNYFGSINGKKIIITKQ